MFAPPPTTSLIIDGMPQTHAIDWLKKILEQYGTIHAIAQVSPTAVEVHVTAAAASWLLANLNGNVPQGLSSPVTVQLSGGPGNGGGGMGGMGDVGGGMGGMGDVGGGMGIGGLGGGGLGGGGFGGGGDIDGNGGNGGCGGGGGCDGCGGCGGGPKQGPGGPMSNGGGWKSTNPRGGGGGGGGHAGRGDLSSQLAPSPPLNSIQVEGTVAQFEKGYGFITFVDRRHAFVHQSQCGGQPLNIGQTVTANLQADPKNPGKWMATDVRRILSDIPNQSDRVEGFVNKWDPRGFGFITLEDGRYAYVHSSSCGDRHLTQGEVVSAIVTEDKRRSGGLCAQHVISGPVGEDGTLMEWNEEKGFGFVQMDDGRRCFLHRSAMVAAASPKTGTRLRVNTKQDARSTGKWMVSEVKAIQEPLVGDRASYGEERLSGQVDKWYPRGFGFFLMEDGRSAFVHVSQCNGEQSFTVGEFVSAVIRPDEKNPGRWAAHDVSKGTYIGESAYVIEWNPARGFGFVNIEGGKRAYIHRSSFGGSGDLVLGQRLTVKIKEDQRNSGKWMVSKVTSNVCVEVMN
eukprot:TRINITY_DN19016_c0_g1_i1.p1 TRINITY_DN19016_c0_g1~~TRINITY_DN19016_c0_g1_i1.p1  ORF type:complete len:567 (-),score=121.97 TRINITY_DN19016_c0_g1_i1:59-1759(-)